MKAKCTTLKQSIEASAKTCKQKISKQKRTCVHKDCPYNYCGRGLGNRFTEDRGRSEKDWTAMRKLVIER